MWQSTDPAFWKGEYLPQMPTDEQESRQLAKDPYGYWKQQLPGMGGVYNAVNGSVYAYGGQNPVKLVDPDGNELDRSDNYYKKNSIGGEGALGLGLGVSFDMVEDSQGNIDFNISGKVSFGVSIGLSSGSGITSSDSYHGDKKTATLSGGFIFFGSEIELGHGTIEGGNASVAKSPKELKAGITVTISELQGKLRLVEVENGQVKSTIVDPVVDSLKKYLSDE